MKLNGLLLMSMILLVALSSCVKNEFTVDIDLSADVDRTYTLVFYASDKSKGWLVEKVVPVSKGKAQVKLRTVKPTLVGIMSGSGSMPQAYFYAERGDKIKITGREQDPAGWQITGNKITEEMSEFRQTAAAEIRLARSNSDEGIAKLNSAVEKYVSSHPDRPSSTLLLLTLYDRRTDTEGFNRVWRKLSGNAAEGEWQELAAPGDMLTLYNPEQKMPASIVLNTFETGCDTLVFGKTPALLYFSKSEAPGHRENMAILRELTREIPDSSRRVIAEISFDSDSLSKSSSIRRDSLLKTIHAWMPLGISDAVAGQLHVGRIPYVIVIDSKGKVTYSGDDMEAASDALKKATGKEDNR